MPNPIKYSTGTESDALRKGNFHIGTGSVGKGPSDVTGYYQAVSPVSGGYVIYMNKEGAPGNLSYHNAPTDNDLITFTNNLAGQSYTTVNECLVYFAGQTDKVCLNIDYEGIVTDGLVFNLDAGFTPSYPKSNTTWYDVSVNTNNGTLTNGPIFSSNGGGSIELDGTNDIIKISNNGIFNVGLGDFTIAVWFYFPYALNHNYIHLFSFDTQNNWAFKAGDSNFGKGIYYYGGNQINRSGGGSFGTWNIEFDVWQYIVITRSSDGYLKKAYYNGNYVGSYNREPKSITCSEINIGWGFGSEYTNQFRGPIQFYNRALSETEVLQNYNAQKGRFGL